MQKNTHTYTKRKREREKKNKQINQKNIQKHVCQHFSS